MRLFVTGTKGQVVSALIERGRQTTADIIALGRPNIDLTDPTSLREAIFPMAPDAIVSAAAFTAVDLAEDETREAFAANASGAGHLAHVARRLDVPIIHLSTDYVFDGRNPAGYREDDPVGPINAYGKSKLAGEYFVQANTLNHAILRTSWVYSPFGANFLKTMLRLAEERDVLSVVDDQRGAPTSAFDIADGILAIAANMLERPKEKALRGTFHMTASGEASWADFAAAIIAHSESHGGPTAKVEKTTTDAFGFKAKRPAHSRLLNDKLAKVHGVRLPPWETSIGDVVARVLADEPNRIAEK